MKVRLIGDCYIDAALMKECFQEWVDMGCDVKELDWGIPNMSELSTLNLKLEQEGAEAVPLPQHVLDFVKDADILITQFTPVNQQLVDNAPNLKAVGTVRAGFENINVEALSKRGIMFFNNPGRNAHAVADFSVAMMLAENRNIARSHAALMKGDWRKNYENLEFNHDFFESVCGIVGFGIIGQLVAKKLSGFDMKLLAYDPFVSQEVAEQHNVKLVDLDTLVKESDFITVNARLAEDNYRMISAEKIAMMKPTAIVVNTARSGLIDEPALIKALQEKKIGGAAIDVFDVEPIGADHPYCKLDNVTLTTHLAGTTRHAVSKAAQRLAREMGKMLQGGKPFTQMNKEAVPFKTLNI